MLKITRSPHWLIRAAATLLAPVYVLSTDIQTYAAIPSAAIISNFRGNELNIRRESNRYTRAVRPSQQNLLGRDTEALNVPGDNSSGATLTFVNEEVWEYAGLRVETIPSNKRSEYRYPCRLRQGSLTIGWRRSEEVQDRACNDGMRVGRATDNNAQLPSSKHPNLIQAAKNLLTAQVDDEVLVVPEAGETLIQTFDTGTGIDIVVAQGDVKVKSTEHPEGKTIKAGEIYSYPLDEITSVDLKALAQSPSIQDFLNPANWPSTDIPQRVADEVAEQMNQHRAALGLPPQPIASTPGNNNNPSQPPTASNPRTSQPTAPTSRIDFPLYETVGVATIPNVQPLTFSPNGSFVSTVPTTRKTQPFTFASTSFSRTSPSPSQTSQLKAINLNYSTEALSQIKNSQIAQIPGINLPIPAGGGGIIQDAVSGAVASQLAGVLDAERPINASLKDAYPTVSEPPGGSFAPSNASLQEFYKALKSGELTISLPPGDYSVPIHVFCMQHSAHAPGSSETFLLAPLKGKQAKAIAALNSKFVAANIDRDTIQSLSWAIQTGTKYEELSAQQRAIVDQLIPEFNQQLSQSFWEKLESTLGKIPGAPSVDSVVGKLGPTGELLNTYRQARAAIQQHGDNYSALERSLLLPGNAPRGGDSRYPRGIWSKISDRIYARLLPTGLGSPGKLDIRVLPASEVSNVSNPVTRASFR